MKILALDSSGLVASCALWEDGKILAELSTNYKKTHSETLLPMIDEMARLVELDKSTLSTIAVSAGPGSFTGLRIGSATAKGMALALDIPLVEVPTLMGLAYNLAGTEELVCPLMDARREQVYCALYRMDEETPKEILPARPLAVSELLSEINALDAEERIVFLGDGVEPYKDLIVQGMQKSYRFAEGHMNRQRAASLAVLAAKLYKAGKAIPGDQHTPVYLRKSQAEQEKERKAAHGNS